MSNQIKKVAMLTMKVVEALELPHASELPIYIGDSNIEHMKAEHPREYEVYGDEMYDMVQDPDYVMKHPHDGSFLFVRERSERVVVAVRPTVNAGRLIIRSLYTITDKKFAGYKEKRKVKSLPSNSDLELPDQALLEDDDGGCAG